MTVHTLYLPNFKEHPSMRVRAHCIFRQCKLNKRHYWSVNDTAYKLRNLITKGLWIDAYEIEKSKDFVDIENRG